MKVFFLIIATLPVFRCQFGLVCMTGGGLVSDIFTTIILRNRDRLKLIAPLQIPGLEENFGLARMYNCGMVGLENTELAAPVEVLCDGENETSRVVLSFEFKIQNTDLVCDLALGMAPTLAAHTELKFHFGVMNLQADLQLPRDQKSKAERKLTKLSVTKISGQKLTMTGLEPVTSLISQSATIGLRITPRITKAFFTEFLKIEAPKILAKAPLPF